MSQSPQTGPFMSTKDALERIHNPVPSQSPQTGPFMSTVLWSVNAEGRSVAIPSNGSVHVHNSTLRRPYGQEKDSRNPLKRVRSCPPAPTEKGRHEGCGRNPLKRVRSCPLKDLCKNFFYALVAIPSNGSVHVHTCWDCGTPYGEAVAIPSNGSVHVHLKYAILDTIFE